MSKYKSLSQFSLSFYLTHKFSKAKILSSPKAKPFSQQLKLKATMAPQTKLMLISGFVYEKNNFVALVDIASSHSDFHIMMNFIKSCKLSYAMLEAPTIYCEVVEEMWTSAQFDRTNGTLSFTIKGKEYVVNSDVVTACFRLPENNCLNAPLDAEII